MRKSFPFRSLRSLRSLRTVRKSFPFRSFRTVRKCWQSAEFEQLVEAIEAAGVDITSDYNDWYKIAIAIANIYIYLIYI